MLTFALSNHFGGPGENWLHINAVINHEQSWIMSMDQLTAVKTRYPLTSITWPYRGLRCRPIEVEYFFEVLRWQVTSFQMIKIWSKFDRWVHAGNLCSIFNLVYFDGWSWQSFVSTCDVFNCLFLLDVQKWNTAAIKSILLFMASLFIGFFGWEMRRSSKSEIRFRMASFSFFTWLEKSEAIRTGLTWYLSGAASRMVSLSNDCIWCLFFISNLMKSSVVYAAI